MVRCVYFLLLSFLLACQTPSISDSRASWSEADRQFLLDHLLISFDAVMDEVADLDPAQWEWQQDSSKWSISLVAEHLVVHEELFYREMRVLLALPEMSTVAADLFASDEAILSYRTVTQENTGRSPTYLEPLGRWCSKEDAMAGYQRARRAMIDLVGSTDRDLRAYYTTSGRGPTSYRDLHQLMLISIAHTERHLSQIRGIKNHTDFPTPSARQ